MHRHQTSSKYAVPKLKPHHHWLFKHKFQKPPLEILGSLVFCIALTLSDPTGSAPTVGDATLASTKIDHRESSVVTHPSMENDSGSNQVPTGNDPELGKLRLRELIQNSPPPAPDPTPIENDPGSNEAAMGDDPELGKLRLRELGETPPPSERSKPTVSLLGNAGYLRSNNLFAGVDPVDDGLLRSGLTLLATPSLGPRTSLFAAVTGNLIRYGEQSEFDYDELRLNLGLRQQLSSRAYGEVGWRNRNLFDEEDGDRFLNDHSFYLELGRRDTLAKQLSLDTFYQFRLSFADPDSRSQATNSLGASLIYSLNPSLQAALDYQFALANFTEQEREDQYHQLIARLTYTLSPNSRLYVFGGHNFGNSSDPNIDFDGLVFGAGVDFNLTLF